MSVAVPTTRDVPCVYAGCAGWNLPPAESHRFPKEGSHLARYAAQFAAAEINSSFYRPHRRSTYAKWAATVPATFRFSVKVPKTITHEHRLAGARKLLDTFIDEVTGLGDKLGCLLVQLPPSLEFNARVAKSFLSYLRRRYAGNVVLEPRHATWFTAGAGKLLTASGVARVAADPALIPAAAEPGAWPGIIYYRLHGSPRMYYSSYSDAYLKTLASRLNQLARGKAPVWCIFDNTAFGVAYANALDLLPKLRKYR
jgi:uncharacterized protein YecE (DUF72 family)